MPTEYKNTDDDIYISLRPYKRRFIFKGWSVADEKPMKNYKITSGTEGNLILVACYETDKSVFYDGAEIDVLPRIVSGYLAATNKAEYLYKNSGASGDEVKSVNISWIKAGSSYYNFELSTDENFENTIYSQEGLTKTSLNLYNLVPDTYYYRVSDRTGEPIKDDSFKMPNKNNTNLAKTQLFTRFFANFRTMYVQYYRSRLCNKSSKISAFLLPASLTACF